MGQSNRTPGTTRNASRTSPGTRGWDAADSQWFAIKQRPSDAQRSSNTVDLSHVKTFENPTFSSTGNVGMIDACTPLPKPRRGDLGKGMVANHDGAGAKRATERGNGFETHHRSHVNSGLPRGVEGGLGWRAGGVCRSCSDPTHVGAGAPPPPEGDKGKSQPGSAGV